MEKQILLQRFNYASITAYKNSSLVLSKPKNLGLNTFSLDDFNDGIILNIDSKNDCKRKNTKYFYSGEETGIRIRVEPFFKSLTYLTNNDSEIKEHYGRAFSSITTHIYERSIFLKDDKITIKTNHYIKSRHFNCKFFKKRFSCKGISINLKSGNICTFTISRGHKQIRRNSFGHLLPILQSRLTRFNNNINAICPENRLYNSIYDITYPTNFKNEFTNEMCDEKFIISLYETLNTIPGVKIDPPTNFNYNVGWINISIVQVFVVLNGIKVPNNYHHLINYWYPTKVFLKKNDNKLIASILDRLKIKSKKTIKLLHENPLLDLNFFYKFVRYFGFEDFHKYIGNVNPSLFSSISDTTNQPGISQYPLNDSTSIFNLNDTEKFNVLKIINDFTEITKITINLNLGMATVSLEQQKKSFLNTLDDHIKMLNNIREFYPEIQFKSQTVKSFNEEHLEFSRRDNLIKRGYTIEYVFDEKLIEFIEKPIIIDDKNTYYPVILKRDVEYTMEGEHMHHCVGSYSDNDSALIVSLRSLSTDGYERITCQYNTKDKRCVQSKYFCNATPPEHFEQPLKILTDKIKNYSKSLISIEKIKTPYALNKNVEVETLF
jgi:hypothetical protein